MKFNSVFLSGMILCLSSFLYGQGSSPLVLVQTVSLPDVQGGFNHMSADDKHQRLFAAAPANKTLEVIDLDSGKPLQSLTGEKPAAALYAPEFNQLYVSRGQSLSIYDGKTFRLMTSVDLESNLDELQYDPRAKELYVGCMSEGKTGVAIIAIPEGKLLGKISMPAKPQGIAVERMGNRIFANMPSLEEVAVLDRKNRVPLQPLSLQDVQGNTPLGLDESHHRLFVGGRHPARLAIIDTSTGKTVAEVAINSDTDDLFYDPAHKRIYVSCGEGFVDVIQQRDADHYELLTRISTVAGARTSTFSRGLNRFILGVPRRADRSAEIRVFKTDPVQEKKEVAR